MLQVYVCVCVVCAMGTKVFDDERLGGDGGGRWVKVQREMKNKTKKKNIKQISVCVCAWW